MKKYILFFLLSSIITPCLAQNTTTNTEKFTPILCKPPVTSRFQFGLYAGANTGAPIPKTVAEGSKGDLGTAFRGGLLAKYAITKRLGLVMECGYAHKTASFSSPVKDQYIEQILVIPNPPYEPIIAVVQTTFSGTTSGSFDLNYLESTLLAEYQLNRHFSIALGAFGADLVQGKNEGVATNVQIGTVPGYFPDQPFDNSAELARFDYGFVGGIGYKLVDNLQLNMRFASGTPSIYLPTFTRVTEALPTRYLQVGFDYRINGSVN
jgi:hypothetical protein